MIIGITGGTGCGKTTLLDMIRQADGLVLDCDAIYHQLLKTDKTLLSAIDSRFPGCVREDGLDRKKLGAIVFADPAALQDLICIWISSAMAAMWTPLSSMRSTSSLWAARRLSASEAIWTEFLLCPRA